MNETSSSTGIWCSTQSTNTNRVPGTRWSNIEYRDSSEQKKKLDRVQHRITRNSNSKLDSVIPKPHQSNVWTSAERAGSVVLPLSFCHQNETIRGICRCCLLYNESRFDISEISSWQLGFVASYTAGDRGCIVYLSTEPPDHHVYGTQRQS